MILILLKLLLSLVFLIIAAEVMLKGSLGLANALNVSPLVIGLTVVAFGTSAPELAINISSLAAGHGDIAIGNVIGSNIFNVLFILGITTLFYPLRVTQKVIRVDIPIMIFLYVLVWLMSLNGFLSFWEGVFFVSGLVFYILFSIRSAKKEAKSIRKEYAKEFSSAKTMSKIKSVVFISLGVLGLALASKFFVGSATELAILMNLSELIIGLTVVACGSAAPEVVISITAARKGESDIAVGNIIGSCIFNILCVLGFTVLLFPNQEITRAAINFDIPIMVVSSVLCIPLFMTDMKVSRWEGAVLVLSFVSYISWITLDSTDHDAAEPFGKFVMFFLVPIMASAVLFTFVRYMKRKT